jgi:hypothetical protein
VMRPVADRPLDRCGNGFHDLFRTAAGDPEFLELRQLPLGDHHSDGDVARG